MARVRDLLTQALDLPLKQRAHIAQALLHSLDDGPPEDPAEVERAWAEEISRRADDIRTGKVKTVAWSTVEREIKEDLAKIRRARSRTDRRRARKPTR